jgi:hypothetical protein
MSPALTSAMTAAVVVGLATWDLTRTLGARRDAPELAEGGIVFGAAAALGTVLVAALINPPSATVGGVTVKPSLRMAVEWAFNTGVYAAIWTTLVVGAIEFVLTARGRIARETTLLRFLTEATE